ncbi:MAG TPA: hypothetical protein PKY82_00700 [Pyrinomonadaceae bacterium]|nr:hypothetical protein [Pyrinomonadaceae bacterium]
MKQKKFVRPDVHKETIAIVVIYEDGQTLIQSIIATKSETITNFLKGLSRDIHLTFEIGTQAVWLYGQVKPLVE